MKYWNNLPSHLDLNKDIFLYHKTLGTGADMLEKCVDPDQTTPWSSQIGSWTGKYCRA